MTRQKFGVITTLPIIMIFTALIFYGAIGVRGNDQFWYVRDLSVLMNGGFHSNIVYPIFLGKNYSLPPMFMHNTINHYLALPLAYLTNEYDAWIILNILSIIASLYLVRGLLPNTATTIDKSIYSIVFLLFPLTVWQASQALIEASQTFLTLLAAYTFLRIERQWWQWGLFLLLLATLLASRFVFVVLPFALLAYYWLSAYRAGDGKVHLHTFLLFVIAISITITIPKLFPSAMLSISDNLLIKSNFSSGMDGYFVTIIPDFSLEGFISNCLKSMIQQFSAMLTARSSIFYIPVNILIASFIFKAYKFRKYGFDRIDLFTSIVLALTLIVVVIFQNQVRYFLPVIPLLLVSLFPVYKELSLKLGQKRILIVFAGVTFIFTSVDAGLMQHTRLTSIETRKEGSIIKEAINNVIPENDNVILVKGKELKVAMFIDHLYPRKVLVINDNEIMRKYDTRETFPANWLIKPSSSDFSSIFFKDYSKVGQIKLLESTGIYEIFKAKQLHR